MAGIDEVGRGAIAGPVTVGVVALAAGAGDFPEGLADSKLLTPRRRGLLDPQVRGWAHAHSTGSASPAEIDRVGIVAALGLAAVRALGALGAEPDMVILDGNTPFLVEDRHGPRVVMRTKADRDCASVAAASVIAKVERDALMVALHSAYPEFGWASNKGYAAAAHTAALRAHGASAHHRRSWNLGV